MHAESDALGGVVGADDRLAPLIAKLEGTEPIGLACGEHGAPLLTVVTHLRNAEGAHRHPEVGQQAAEPIEGELAPQRRLQEREQQAGHQPEAQHVGRKPQPACPQRLGIGEAQQGAPQQAEQAWEQHLDAALGCQMLPAQARQLGHQRHQAEGQRHEDGIEIGGAHRE